MKKMPAPMTEPAQNDNTNHTLKLAKKPVSKFQTYQLLLDEFLTANPTPTDAELSRACQHLAKQCGLTLASNPKAKSGGSHV